MLTNNGVQNITLSLCTTDIWQVVVIWNVDINNEWLWYIIFVYEYATSRKFQQHWPPWAASSWLSTDVGAWVDSRSPFVYIRFLSFTGQWRIHRRNVASAQLPREVTGTWGNHPDSALDPNPIWWAYHRDLSIVITKPLKSHQVQVGPSRPDRHVMFSGCSRAGRKRAARCSAPSGVHPRKQGA